ncbi:retron system putative HNH endonuclease [Aeromonas salmonicida]|uniref:retron system putative HNH endonuclease n=1 Tax=Aeromonas salmonicida TaxID=645 RepID=UPI003D5B267C
MKKTIKSESSIEFSRYAEHNPTANWQRFRDLNNGATYNAVKTQIFSDQGGLCAYCEVSLKEVIKNKRRLEHFHSKSDNSDPHKNWALTWSNIIGVCVGGSEKKQDDDSSSSDTTFPIPENLSCDSYKAYLEEKGLLSKNIEGYVLNPLEICNHSLFNYDISTGKLIPNKEKCLNFTPVKNNFNTSLELVENTLFVFNLNCERLTIRRKVIFNYYQKRIKEARKKNDTTIFNRLAETTFRNKWPSFFTTRRIILGHAAELFLAQINYSG